MQRKLMEGIVAAAVLVLKGLKLHDKSPGGKSYRHGIYDMLTALLMRPGVSEVAVYEKVKAAFEGVHRDFVHTKLAEEKIVEALLA